MKIGIDARLINETGIGRYIRNLIRQLSILDEKNTYIVYLLPSAANSFTVPNDRWQVRLVNITWHSLAEQFILPFIYLKDSLDILHVPYFTIPIFYFKKKIVTIHDLIILHHKTGKATKLPYILYTLKHIGYLFILHIGLLTSSSIITVSKTTKKQIQERFRIPEKKIVVTYEGIDEYLLQTDNPKNKPEKKNMEPYFLYVGNAYPHKNLEMLIHSLSLFHTKHPELIWQFVFVGNDSFFYPRIKKLVQKEKIDQRVLWQTSVSDSKLRELYQDAQALVFPSVMEGFGLPAIEALSLGCPVIVSDIPVFREILPQWVTFVPSMDMSLWAHALKDALEKPKYLWAEKEKREYFKNFSWKMLAKQTLQLYENSFSL